jgi:pSer/pThr/pTyr-binding forkhead associated (FHA) protein/DNA-directed RNA polymerase subunit RPC12/RpoP
MESLTSGTMAGTGAFRCEACGHVVTLAATEALAACPECGGQAFSRTSLFAAGRFERVEDPQADLRAQLVSEARRRLFGSSGRHLAFQDGEELRIVALENEYTRIGRSLAADIRFDDPTVSRRHALIVIADDDFRVLDDRSLNGVFVNGERVEWRSVRDGDEIVVGRHRLHVLDLGTPASATAPASDSGAIA